MKKFYTILAAAAVAFGASAVAPQAVPVGKTSTNKVFTEKTFQLESIKTKKSVAGMQDVVRSTRAGITLGTPIDKLPGYYAENEYSIISDGAGGAVGWQGPIQNLVNLGDAENTLDVYGFWLGSDKNGRFNNVVTGNYDQSKSTLSFPAGTFVATVNLQGGGTADVYMYILNLNTGKYETGDIVFTYSAAAHGFSYEATDDGTNYTSCLFFTSDKDAAGSSSSMKGFDFLVDCSLNLFNGAMDFTIKAQEEGGEDTKTGDYIYAESFDNSLLVYNMGGNGYDKVVEFTVNKSASTASLVDQNMTLPISAGGTRTYYFINTDGQSMTIPFTGVTTVEGEGADQMYITTLKSDGYWFLSQDYYGYQAADVTIELLDFDLFAPTAIKNVSADFDENAPVEYFNLQGVRVENPANGLYIKRQGNKVAKVIL